MTPEPLEPETLEAKIAHLNGEHGYGAYEVRLAMDVIDQLLAERDSATKGERAADQEVQRLQAEREKDKAYIKQREDAYTLCFNERMTLLAEADEKLAAKDKLLAMARDISNETWKLLHEYKFEMLGSEFGQPLWRQPVLNNIATFLATLSQQDTRPPLPEGFAYATSAELFQALGKPKYEAESMERGLNAVVRREEIRANNTQQDTGTTALSEDV